MTQPEFELELLAEGGDICEGESTTPAEAETGRLKLLEISAVSPLLSAVF